MTGLIIAGWFPRARVRKRRPVQAIVQARRVCEFCRNEFECTGRRDRVRRTCGLVCAARLRVKAKQARAQERFKAARMARWLLFPKEAIGE